jgi:hypothetical protein
MRGVRIRGLALAVLGTALAIGMAFIMLEVGGAMVAPAPAGPRFTGTREEGQTIAALLSGVFVLGVGFTLYGIFMAASGRELRAARIIAAILLVLMIAASVAIADVPALLRTLF